MRSAPPNLAVIHLPPPHGPRYQDAVIVAVAKNQRIVLWNPAATNIFGYSASEALGLRVEDLVPKYLKDQHGTGIAHYAETGLDLTSTRISHSSCPL